MPEVRKLWQTEGLFSEHYLKARIQRNGWWPTDDAVRPLWQFCVELFNRRYVPCAQNNEAFTRQELLNPILAKLGFAWTDNLGLPDQDAEPDYILFASAAEKEAVIALNREKRYRASAALLEAKKVNHPLSQISKHQQRYERCVAKNDAIDALEFVEKQLREKRADVIHDLLAFRLRQPQ